VRQIYTCEYTDAVSENADLSERGEGELTSESSPVTTAATEKVCPSSLAKVWLPAVCTACAPACLLHQTNKVYRLGAGSVRSASFRPSAPLTCYRRRLLLHDEHELTAFGYAS
jgi:hypothetical protein